jgi:hypothetical protein
MTDLLDGAAPRAIRVVGTATPVVRAGEHQLFRDGRADAALEAELARRLGRVAIVDGELARGVLEAHLRGITAVVLEAPHARPARTPRGVALVVVVAGEPSGWAADLPGL